MRVVAQPGGAMKRPLPRVACKWQSFVAPRPARGFCCVSIATGFGRCNGLKIELRARKARMAVNLTRQLRCGGARFARPDQNQADCGDRIHCDCSRTYLLAAFTP